MEDVARDGAVGQEEVYAGRNVVGFTRPAEGDLFEHAGEVFSLPFSRHDGTGSQTVDTNPTGQFTGEVASTV